MRITAKQSALRRGRLESVDACARVRRLRHSTYDNAGRTLPLRTLKRGSGDAHTTDTKRYTVALFV